LKLKVLFGVIAVALIALTQPQPAQARTSPVVIPFSGEIKSGSFSFPDLIGGQDTLTLVVPSVINCPAFKPGEIGYPIGVQVFKASCTFNVFAYTDHTDNRQYPQGLKSYAAGSVQSSDLNMDVAGHLSPVTIFTGSELSGSIVLSIYSVQLQASYSRPAATGFPVLNSKQFVNPCPKVGKQALHNFATAVCKKVKTKKKWVDVYFAKPVAGSSTPLTKVAFELCNLAGKDDVTFGAQLGDNGKTLNLMGLYLSYNPVTVQDFTCVRGVLGMPLSVTAHMDGTRALDGRQSDTWGDLSASWTYHPTQGLNIIITSR
jgi:hypothetical protein